ncbi:hypothetical protein GGR56DRAFT_617527 [Xylariaceae sp. FL0804]|nr:hypothetical protein GGR56DRAFT_617527 [Xylariaceae sp. FL0804]
MAAAIATLSLVCNVMQVVSFTEKIVRICRSTLKEGTPEPGLSSDMAHFSALLSSLQDSVVQFTPISTGAVENQVVESSRQLARVRLKTIASDLSTDTKELLAVLGKVTATPSSSNIKRILIVFKYKFRDQRKITSLEKKIGRTWRVLNTELLNSVWCVYSNNSRLMKSC